MDMSDEEADKDNETRNSDDGNDEAKSRDQELLDMKEKEKDKFILERMDWDKNFGGDGDGLIDDLQSGMRNPAMMSEFEQIKEEKV